MYREGNVDFMISIFRDELPDAVYQEIAWSRCLWRFRIPIRPSSMPIRWRATGFCIWICAIWTGRPLSFRCRIRACAGPQTISWSRPISGLGGLLEIGHFDVIMSMVNQGLGIGFNRLGYIQDMQKFDHVRYFLIDREAYQSSLVLVYRKAM